MPYRLIATLTAVAFAFPAGAEMYKCRTPDGSTSYQGAPCTQGASGERLQLKETPAQNYQHKAGDQRAMKEAFDDKMAKGDYDGALAFAGDDKQRAQATKAKIKKEAECASLRDKARSARAAADAKGPRWEKAAETALSNYRAKCG